MNELPADAVYDLTRPMQVAVSPDGARVAFQAVEYDRRESARRSSIFTVPADGGLDPNRLTRVSDAGTMKWSPEGSRLGVVMTRERDVELRVGSDDTDGKRVDEVGGGTSDADAETDAMADAGNGNDPRPQLWVYDLERGGDARQVTDHDVGIREFDWGPAGERVVVSARGSTDENAATAGRRDGGPIETERLQHKFDGVGWLESVSSRLSVVEVESRETYRLADAYGGGILEASQGLQPAWHPEDDRIAFVSNHGENPEDTYAQAVHVVDAESGDTKQLTSGDRMVRGPTWSPDGSRLAVIASDPTDWYVPANVRVVDAETGESRAVTDDLDRHLAWFERVVWLDDERLLTAIGDEGWSRFVRLSAAGGYERVYDRQSRDASLTQFHAAGDAIAYVRQHPWKGIDVFGMGAGDLDATADDDDPRRRLTDLNPDLVADYDHPEIERIDFRGPDGDAVEGIAFYPPAFDPDDPDGDRPLLVSIHGGPRRYDEPHFDFDTAFWTSRGYVVFKVNYHGSTSYGRAFCERLAGEWNDVEVVDLLAGTEELVERGWVDPDRLFVTGFSYGGRLTAAAVVAETDRFAAAVAEHGNYDARSAFGSDDRHRWWENELGLPWENPRAYDEASAITNVDVVETPLVLTAGGNDLRDPSTQAEQLYVSLKKRGVESKLVVYPDTHHVHYFVAEPDRAVHRLETMSEWFGRFDPAVEDDGHDAGTFCE